MEKILVAIDIKHRAWEALSHACSLVKRIDAELYVLLILSTGGEKKNRPLADIENEIKKRLELVIEKAKNENIIINYYLVEGNYEQEIITFIDHNKITLLAHEANLNDREARIRDTRFLRSLRSQLSCAVEIVVPKPESGTD
jgi:nucleotide-binding universal stress UspA family protein